MIIMFSRYRATKCAIRLIISSVFTFGFLHCMQIRVDTVNPICQEERAYNDFRAKYSFDAMQNFLQQNISGKSFPKVACCLSGGGYRAMISSTAFLHAFEDIGLLGAVKYVSSLSGSTWALGHMLARDSVRPEPLTMQEFSLVLKKAVSDVPFFHPKTFHWAHLLGKMAHIRFEMGAIQPADFWGALLSDRLMHDLQDNGTDVQNITFEGARLLLKKSLKYPFPIFTASIDDFLPYQWIEVNPFVSGGDYLMAKDKMNVPAHYSGAYIPTLALGSCFANGDCNHLFHEKSIGSMMGIFGSPYSASIADIVKLAGQEIENYLADKIPQYWERRALELLISGLTEYFCEREHLDAHRFLPTHVDNFLCGMDSILKDLPKVIMSDAGFDENLPILPLLKREREVDIILICDASSDATWKDHPEMSRIRDLALRYGFKFPSLRNKHVINDHLIIYEDSDPSVPTIVYFINAVYEPTLKFDYSEKEFCELYDFMYLLVKSNKSILQSVISNKISGLSAIKHDDIKLEDIGDFVVIGDACAASSAQGVVDQGSVVTEPKPKSSGYGFCGLL